MLNTHEGACFNITDTTDSEFRTNPEPTIPSPVMPRLARFLTAGDWAAQCMLLM